MRWGGIALAILMMAGTIGAAPPGRPLNATFYAAKSAPGIVEVALDDGEAVPAGVRLIEDGVEGNAPAGSKPFAESPYGVNAVLAIDVSGSMKGAPFNAVKAALRDFVSSARARDRIAIVSFADTVEVRQPFTSDKQAINRAIDAMVPGGKFTVLNQGLEKGLALLADEKMNSRRHLLVVTDGRNEGPGPPSAALQAEALRLRIPIDCIGITRLAPRFLAPSQALAAATGGAYVRVRNYDQLKGAMREGIDWLLKSRVLSFSLAHIRPDGAKHALQLKFPERATEVVTLTIPPAALSPALVYVPVLLAAMLFLFGMALIIHGWRKPSASVANGPVSTPPPSGKTSEASGRAPARAAKTVLAPPAARPDKRNLPIPDRKVPLPDHAPPPVPAQARIPSVAAGSPPIPGKPTELRELFAAPAQGQPAAWLRGEAGPAAGVRFPIDALEIWIGSEAGNKILLANDPAASRNHACIQWANGDLYLLDNRSTNGTSVNGRRMESGSRARLRTGDRIGIGRSTFSLIA